MDATSSLTARPRLADRIRLADLPRALGFLVVAWAPADMVVDALASPYRDVLPMGWVLLFVVVSAALLTAVRIVARDVVAPADPSVHVFRWRDLTAIAEVVIAGTGALLLLVGAAAIVGLGLVHERAGSISIPELLVALALGALGFLLLTYRPAWEIDRRKRTVKKYPLGRAFPWARTSAYEIRLRLETCRDYRGMLRGYFITGRTSDLKAGRFRVQFLLPSVPEAEREEHLRRWRDHFRE